MTPPEPAVAQRPAGTLPQHNSNTLHCAEPCLGGGSETAAMDPVGFSNTADFDRLPYQRVRSFAMKTTGLRLFFLLLLCVPVGLNAQVANANMNVIVQDSTGAVVPGATVKVINSQTGLVRTGVANDRGEVQIPFLPVGQYSVSAEARGFKTTTIAAVVLQVDQTAGIHVTLQPGEVHEIVEVQETAASLETETSSLGQVIENKKILDLPLK